MSSQTPAGLAATGYGTSQLPRYLAWSPVLLGAVIAPCGARRIGNPLTAFLGFPLSISSRSSQRCWSATAAGDGQPFLPRPLP